MPRPRTLNFMKCDFCRRDKQKCMPLARDWPRSKCERCIKNSLACSANRRARRRRLLSNQLESSPQPPTEIGAVHSVAGQYQMPASEINSARLKSQAQCLQEVGDLRHLLDCWDPFDWLMACEIKNPVMETRRKESLKLHEQLESILKKALKDMERCAAQLASDNHYADAEYLYRRIQGRYQRQTPYLQIPYKELKILAGLYEKMLDLPTMEIVQETMLRGPAVWTSHTPSQPDIENLVRLYSLFHRRISSMDIGAELISATSILYRAIALDNVFLFESLAEKGLIPQPLDFFGRTALHIAANANATKVARYLLDLQPDIDAKDGFGQSAILTASKYRYGDMVQILVEEGADVNVVDNDDADEGKSALLWAAAAGDEKTIQLLLDAGADINYRAYNDGSGRCALEEAINGGRTAVLQLLLENNADTEGRNSEAWTALHLAVENEDEIAVQKLLEKGADISVLTSVPIHMDESGMLLQKAVRAGRLSMVKLLIHYGLDLDTKEHNECDGRTALHCAAAAGDVRMVDLLLGAGADINIRAYSDESGDTALGFAIDNDHDAIIQLLLENGADVDLGHSLASAICGTQKSTVHRLIEHEVDLEAPQGDFYTGGAAIHVAVNENCGEILELLLEHGANIEARDNCGYTALALAVVMRTTKIVQLLLQNGADTTSQSKEGETPLHLAAMGDYDGVVQLLLDFGADLSLKDRYGRTAAHLADLAGDDKTVQLLQVDATP